MTDPANMRVLLCRPHGGLNDTLCRIAHCWRYATRFGRHLLIDTRRCSLQAPLDQYFEWTGPGAPVSCALDASAWSALNAMRCRPACIEGRVDSACAIRVRGAGNAMDSRTFMSLRFAEVGTSDFERDHGEQLLVWEGSGGGTESADVLPHLRLAPHLRSRVEHAVATLEPAYSALHVRNTDYRTDYRRLFRRVRRLGISGPLLVCSDDPRVVACARRMLRNPILAFSGRARSLDRTGALHLPSAYASEAEVQNAVAESIIDLIALGNAQRLCCGTVMNGWASGFSFLACHLCRNKGVIDSLLGVPRAQWRDSEPGAAMVLDIAGGWRQRAWLLRRRAGALRRAVASRAAHLLEGLSGSHARTTGR